MKNLIILCTIFILFSSTVSAYDGYNNKTIGGNVYGSIPLVDTTPEMDLGIGGGMFFDYRFNERYSIQVESFFTTQDGKNSSSGEGDLVMLALPAVTLKLYVLNQSDKFDPYIGVGVGLYGLLEGTQSNNSGGWGMGGQIEVGVDYKLTENIMLGAGGTYRSIGLINSLSGNANATAIMPYTLFGRVGYRF